MDTINWKAGILDNKEACALHSMVATLLRFPWVFHTIVFSYNNRPWQFLQPENRSIEIYSWRWDYSREIQQ